MATLAGSFLTNPLYQMIGFAAGTAIGPALRPEIQDIINTTWNTHPNRRLSVEALAAMKVEGVQAGFDFYTEANDTGFANERLDALVQLIDDPPDVATLYQLWRRGLIGETKFRQGLRHLRIETDYFDALVSLHNVLLTPEQLAAARVKGHIDQARQFSESELWGVTNDRAQIMYETTGNPPGPETLITMLNRGIINEGEFAQGIKQGNIRPEYVDEYLALRRHLLTPTEVVNLRLRGWHDDAWMNARGAELGYPAETMHDLFLGQGRPVSFRQVFIGERRGGVYDGPTGGIDPPFLKSLQESNIRPEWYNLAWAQRHSLPSAFVLRALTQNEDISEADAERYLLWLGWPSELAAKVSAAWAPTTGDVDQARIKSAQTQAVTEIRNAYLIGQTDDGQARGWLGRVGVNGPTQDRLLPIWDVMREVPQRGLTPAQIKKAFTDSPQIYTRERAMQELGWAGLPPDKAATLLDE